MVNAPGRAGVESDVTVGLNRVGVTGVEKLVKLGRRDRDPIVLMAEFEVFVDLPSWRKGPDMSRNMEVIDETLETAVSEEALSGRGCLSRRRRTPHRTSSRRTRVPQR